MKATTVITALSGASTAFPLLGQTTVDPGIGTLVGNLGIMGVLVWHLWYHTTHSYPKMMEKFSGELDKLRTAFATEQQAQRLAFLTDQQAERAASEAEKAELRKTLIMSLTAMRTAVHDVRDTAQSAILKSAAERADKESGEDSKP